MGKNKRKFGETDLQQGIRIGLEGNINFLDALLEQLRELETMADGSICIHDNEAIDLYGEIGRVIEYTEEHVKSTYGNAIAEEMGIDTLGK